MKNTLISCVIAAIIISGCIKPSTVDNIAATSCYQCTTYTRCNIHTPGNVSYSEMLLQCGLTASDVAKINTDTAYDYAYYYGSAIGEVLDTVFINCK